ncbi:MAG: two-component system, response regulator PdtaR [Clostridia bacterium]|jgi:response regulator NasT|nr:two-component system, response regulator PdtaR [Clostridia bacterium]MDN5321571.1 two-component system, response regulator PdtaR [Clostridia bacterium]
MQKGILIAVKNQQQSNKLKKILTSHGYQIIASLDDAYSVLRTLQSKEVAISLIDNELQGMNGLQLAQIIADENLGPVVLLSQHHVDTGSNPPKSLFGVLLKPITEYQLINTLNLALIQYKTQKKLEKEVADLKDTLESRKIIEKAKGILMKKYGLAEDAAYNKLRKSSMEKRIPMKKVAEAIILMDEL